LGILHKTSHNKNKFDIEFTSLYNKSLVEILI